jgi:hypothetical protein
VRVAKSLSLVKALKGNFDQRWEDLPTELQQLLKRTPLGQKLVQTIDRPDGFALWLSPETAEQQGELAWNIFSPEQRREAARQWDDDHDPANEEERQAAFDLAVKHSDLQREIREWEVVATPTAMDKETKERRLAELKRELNEDRIALQACSGGNTFQPPASPSECNRHFPTPKDEAEFLTWATELAKERGGKGPSHAEAYKGFAKPRGLARDTFVRPALRGLPSGLRQKRGGSKRRNTP